jgi:hypothetical protein
LRSPPSPEALGGRFTGATDPMEKFNEVVLFDKRLWAEKFR